MDITHHRLGFGGVGQQGQAARLFDLVDDPIPIADGLQGDRGSRWQLGEEIPDGPPRVVHPRPSHRSPLTIEDREEGGVLVSVARDLIMGMVRQVAPPMRNGSETTTSGAGGAALSYNQLAEADPAG